MPALLVVFHTPSNEGFAMAPLEKMFYEVAVSVVGGSKDVHFAFKNYDKGKPTTLPSDFDNYLQLDYAQDVSKDEGVINYIRKNNIEYVFAFDLSVQSRINKLLRKAGVRKIISYWGSTMSSKNSGIKLLYKKLEVLLNRYKPDAYIFESNGMRDLAVYGRGIPKRNTFVVPTGVDVEKFQPSKTEQGVLKKEFDIADDVFTVFYSGHMEKRKGVDMIIRAAIELIDNQGVDKIAFLICGNRPGEEQIFLEMLEGKKARSSVIFAGYRSDLADIMPECHVGVIASTGWDSFPMSSLEMAACGLPILVSDLEGLSETVEDGGTGYLFPVGDWKALSQLIKKIKMNSTLKNQLAQKARERIVREYTLTIQKSRLLGVLLCVIGR